MHKGLASCKSTIWLVSYVLGGVREGWGVHLGWLFLAARQCGQPGSGASIDLPGLLQSFNYSCTPAMCLKLEMDLKPVFCM